MMVMEKGRLLSSKPATPAAKKAPVHRKPAAQ
jgi:hypothetical protein